MTDLGEDLYGAAPTEPPAFDLGADLYGNSPSTPAGPAGFLDRVGADMAKRGDTWNQISSDYQQGKHGLPFSTVKGMGKVVAGGVNDIVGEGLQSAYGMLPDAAQQYVGQKATDFMGTDLGKEIAQKSANTGAVYKDVAKAYPNATDMVESVANIASALPPVKAAEMAIPVVGNASKILGSGLEKVGDVVKDNVNARIVKKRGVEVQNILTQKPTSKVLREQAAHESPQGWMGNYAVDPTNLEQTMIDHVTELPVSGAKSLRTNRRIIDKANKMEGQLLKQDLAAADAATPHSAIIPKQTVMSQVDAALAPLRNEPLLHGTTHVENIFNKIDQMVPGTGMTASDLLDLRKNFDFELKEFKGDKIFESTKEHASRIARQTINDIISKKYPYIDVKKSLEKQHAYFNAIKNIDTKIPDQSRNALMRMGQSASNIIPLKGTLAKTVGVVGGLSGLGLVMPSALPIAGGLTGAYMGGKAIKWATTPVQKVTGATFVGAGRALQGKNPFVP